MTKDSANLQSNMNPAGAISLGIFLAIVVVVHLFFQGVVRPFADAAILAQGSGATSNLWVIFKDFEQQASVSIGLFCAFLIIYKYQRIVLKEEPLFTMDYLAGLSTQMPKNPDADSPNDYADSSNDNVAQDSVTQDSTAQDSATQNNAAQNNATQNNAQDLVIDTPVETTVDAPLDVKTALHELEASQYAENSSMATWINCLRRYKNTQNVQHASQAISESIDILAAQLESGNSMIRYFIWAIPSIGFVGTVRGIGSALAKAEEAVAGDISGMVDKLGVAFNSTLVSLLISIVLMYLLHVLNSRQDEMVIKTQKNCEKHLLTRLHN